MKKSHHKRNVSHAACFTSVSANMCLCERAFVPGSMSWPFLNVHTDD